MTKNYDREAPRVPRRWSIRARASEVAYEAGAPPRPDDDNDVGYYDYEDSGEVFYLPADVAALADHRQTLLDALGRACDLPDGALKTRRAVWYAITYAVLTDVGTATMQRRARDSAIRVLRYTEGIIGGMRLPLWDRANELDPAAAHA